MGIGVSFNQKKTDINWMQAAIHLDSVVSLWPGGVALNASGSGAPETNFIAGIVSGL
jgi:hypothetical protein